MSNNLVSPESFTVDMTVLDIQRERFKWVQQQQSYIAQNSSAELCPMPQFHGLIENISGSEELIQLKRPEAYLGGIDLPKFGNFPMAEAEFDERRMDFVPSQAAISNCILRTNSCQMPAADTAMMMKEEEGEGEGVGLMEKIDSTTGRSENLNKRKAEFVVAEECRDRRVKKEVEAESKVKAESNGEISSNASKENSKASVDQKPDYIHVRARRGQATDNHSLAERARRAKISKKMKCLQDLVPGCNKITGKPGMLDEVINYVQSLQRQVEFLSMKLAIRNPWIEFDIDNFSPKEFPAYIANFPAAAAKSSAMANLGCLQFNPAQRGVTSCVLDMPMNPTETTAKGRLCLDSLRNSVENQLFSTWDADSQSLYNAYNLGFHRK